jgi:hypothetical protein
VAELRHLRPAVNGAKLSFELEICWRFSKASEAVKPIIMKKTVSAFSA